MSNRFTGMKDGTLWYYGELAAAYRIGGAGPQALLNALEAAVVDMRSA